MLQRGVRSHAQRTVTAALARRTRYMQQQQAKTCCCCCCYSSSSASQTSRYAPPTAQVARLDSRDWSLVRRLFYVLAMPALMLCALVAIYLKDPVYPAAEEDTG